VRIEHLAPVVPGLFLYEGENNGRAPFSHACVIRGEAEVLVDAGCGIGRLRQLTSKWKPDMALVSHSHHDHCSGLWVLEGARIVSPIEHADIFWRIEPMSVRFAPPGELAAQWADYVRQSTGIREVEADEHYRDGQVFDFGRIRLECMHAPGHTEDHYVFFEPRHGVALIFDIDLTSFGPWYAHPESDIEAFLASIRRVKERRPKIVISSHKGVITDDIPGRLDRYAAVVDRRDAVILSLLDKPKTVAGLVEETPIFGKHPRIQGLLRYFEGVMIEKHLERLRRRGRRKR